MGTQPASLNILILEDNPSDVELITAHLKEDGMSFHFRAVQTQQDYIHAIETDPPDVILADYTLPHFNACEALDLAQEKVPETVFIIVSGTIDDAAAVACIRAGADDYVLKDRMQRLGSAVRNALERTHICRRCEVSETRYRQLVETANSIIVRWAPDGTITYMNDFGLKFFGYSRDELEGRHLLDTIVPPQESNGRDLSQMLKDIAEHTERYVSNENENVCKDGRRVWVSWTNKALTGRDGKVEEVLAIGNDITGMKEKDRALNASLAEAARTQRQVNGLLKSSRAAISGGTFEETARSIFDTCRELIGATSGYVALLSDDGSENEVLFLESGGLPCSVDPDLPMPIRGLREEAYRTKKAVFDNAFIESRWMQYMPEGHVVLNNVLFAPLVINEKAVGLLGLANKEGGFTERDGQLAAAFGEIASLALDNSRTIDAIRLHRERFQSLAENTHDGIIIIENKTPVYMNRRAEEITGYSFEEMKTVNPTEMVVPEDRQRVGKLYDDYRNRDVLPGEIEFRIVHKNGGIRDVRNRYSQIKMKGLTRRYAVITDITESRQARRQLEEQAEELRSLLKSMMNAFVLFDSVFDDTGVFVSYRFVYINDAFERITGVTNEEVRGKTVHQVWPDTEPEWIRRYGEVAVTGVTQTFDLYHDPTKKLYHCNVYRPWDTSDRFCVIFEDITERRRQEEKIYRSEKLLAEAQRLARIGSWEHERKAGTMIWSDELYRLLGYRPGEVTPSKDLFSSHLNTADRDVFNAVHTTDKADHEQEYALSTKDNRLRHVRARTSFDCDESGTIVRTSGIVQDITEIKQAQDELHESQLFLENIFKSTPDVIIVTDSAGTILMVNDTVERLLGYAPAEIIGQHTAILTPGEEEHKSRIAAIMNRLHETGLLENEEYPFRRKDGTLCYCEWNCIGNRHDDGTLESSVSVLRDITERKRAEQHLRQSQKMEAIGTLAGGIAHDFNNILGAIVGFTDMSLSDLPQDHPVHYNLEQVMKSSMRARDLVKQILSFSRKAQKDFRPLELQGLLGEIVRLLRATIPATISIQYDISDEVGPVLADATQVHQVIMNLATNARHAMRKQGGVLTITLREEEVQTSRYIYDTMLEQGRYAVVSVKDNGSGIAPDILAKIFEPFYTTKEVGEGTGMGLAVVHGIVSSHRGAIEVESRAGEGSTFKVFLPLAEKKDEKHEGEDGEIPRGTGHVLFVDDEELLRDVGRAILESIGYRVTACGSAAAGLKAFQEDPRCYDVVITDQTMPDMTGYELAGELMKTRKDIPVILCTGYSEEVTEETARAAGIREYVLKPLDRRNLAQAVRKVLDEKG